MTRKEALLGLGFLATRQCGQNQQHPVDQKQDQRQNKDKKPHRKKFFWQAPLRRQGPSLKELMDLEELASKAYR